MEQTRPEDPTRPEIVRRRVKIDFDSAPAEAWSTWGPQFENTLTAISFLLPVGERFFIKSLRHYLPKLTDPKLREQAQQFIFQEVMHTREHERSNAVLTKVHPYGPWIERMADITLTIHSYTSFKASQLATTCAMEHFTAIIANDLLRHQEAFRATSDPAFSTLWLWHAVEETEHKAVCFDVYEQVCGKGFFAYLHRVVIMGMVTLMLVAAMVIGFRVVGRRTRDKDGKPVPARPKLSALARSVPGRLYFDYFRRSFHPWDHDNMALVDEWKRHYADLGIPKNAPVFTDAGLPATAAVG